MASSPSFSAGGGGGRPLALGLYGLALLVGLFELAALWLALHPHVDANYRAYFLDKTTTCLDHAVPGDYAIGERLSFTSEGYGPAAATRVCGWSGPAGDGTHSIGEESRLRLVWSGTAVPSRLEITLTAVEREGHPRQRVVLRGNGVSIGEVTIPAGETRAFSLPLTAAVFLSRPHRLDLELEYPDAIRMYPTDADIIKRAIKLVQLTLVARGM
jgi:hypothetical protein